MRGERAGGPEGGGKVCVTTPLDRPSPPRAPPPAPAPPTGGWPRRHSLVPPPGARWGCARAGRTTCQPRPSPGEPRSRGPGRMASPAPPPMPPPPSPAAMKSSSSRLPLVLFVNCELLLSVSSPLGGGGGGRGGLFVFVFLGFPFLTLTLPTTAAVPRPRRPLARGAPKKHPLTRGSRTEKPGGGVQGGVGVCTSEVRRRRARPAAGGIRG